MQKQSIKRKKIEEEIRKKNLYFKCIYLYFYFNIILYVYMYIYMCMYITIHIYTYNFHVIYEIYFSFLSLCM